MEEIQTQEVSQKEEGEDQVSQQQSEESEKQETPKFQFILREPSFASLHSLNVFEDPTAAKIKINCEEIFEAAKKFDDSFEQKKYEASKLKFLRVPRGKSLRFVIEGKSDLYVEKVVYCNYPPSLDIKFNRDHFYPYNATEISEITLLSPVWQVDLPPILRSGSFEYFLQRTVPGITKAIKSQTSLFCVDPYLGKKLPLEGIVLQTVLTKCLGPTIEDNLWREIIRSAAINHYNVIHFTPIQELGQSQSAYSLYEHHSISPHLSPKFRKDLDINSKSRTLYEELEKLRNGHELYFLIDVVWNHTANNTPWLSEHPECGYNLENSPHLKVAFELDTQLSFFSNDIARGKYPDIDPFVDSEEKLSRVIHTFKTVVWKEMRLWEYFVVDVDKTVKKFEKLLKETPDHFPWATSSGTIRIQDLGTGERFSHYVSLEEALNLFEHSQVLTPELIESRCKQLREILNKLNLPIYLQLDKDLEIIVSNLAARIRYERIDPHGARKGRVTEQNPLFEPYFGVIQDKKGGKHVLAFNGWIWAANPLINFAEKESKAYFLRQVIIWSDCIKLRYGRDRNDCPWLWDYMNTYTKWMAHTFSGFRLDNCHSTPLHVAQYLLDSARQVCPDLLVTAELFTGSEELDAYYAAKLGINALIRESMNAPDTYEMGRLAHRNGGNPVGSIRNDPSMFLQPQRPGAIFFDCTHDNETPAQKRTPQDTLSTAAIVSMSCCAVGSTRGYDEVLPKAINLITETRHYQVPDTKIGIIAARSILNKLHKDMAIEGYEEIHVHQTGNILTIQRHHPETCKAYYAIIRTAFPYSPPHLSLEEKSVIFPAKIQNLVLGAHLYILDEPFVPNPKEINGLKTNLFLTTHEVGDFCSIEEQNSTTHITLNNFPPGSVLVFRASLFPDQDQNLSALQDFLGEDITLDETFDNVTFTGLNTFLYRCEAEELATTGNGSYNVPQYGKFVYCGISSVHYLLCKLEETNDLGHPLFNNLRAGDWLMDYIVNRLDQDSSLAPVQSWLRQAFQYVKQLPRHLIPKFFHKVMKICYSFAKQHALSLFSPFVHESNNPFIHKLAMGSIQMYGIIPGVPLLTNVYLASFAAGLPHFSTGFMRNWGRDTFISLRGLFLVTGRYDDAKKLILAYAACSRHGLIPNLLDSGNSPRFNARDATWWFLQGIQDYYTMAPDGKNILSEIVTRRFPSDSFFDRERVISKRNSIAEIIQEIMEKHANGIHFREWNAGTMIDSHMKDEGFNIDITLQQETGLIFGGNAFNCGTWMDKMGESETYGTKGIPATPRDGAAIEIIGLLKSTLRWLTSLCQQSLYPWPGVHIVSPNDWKSKIIFTYEEWNSALQNHFEKCFWIPENSMDDQIYRVNSKMIHRRGVYRDTLGSTAQFTDYQLRPNICIAMALAPELFNPKHAIICLNMIQRTLIGPLGMRTLDPEDWNYRPNYDNSDNSSYHTAKGFNYHQGPEWLWPLGFYLRAFMKFNDEKKSIQFIHSELLAHRDYINSSEWAGLPELTNLNGSFCKDSCPTQAWSLATLLDVYYDLHGHIKDFY